MSLPRYLGSQNGYWLYFRCGYRKLTSAAKMALWIPVPAYGFWADLLGWVLRTGTTYGIGNHDAVVEEGTEHAGSKGRDER